MNYGLAHSGNTTFAPRSFKVRYVEVDDGETVELADGEQILGATSRMWVNDYKGESGMVVCLVIGRYL